MNTIDFDDTVEFVWSWAAQLNAHLSVHGWTCRDDANRIQRGIKSSARLEIVDHLLDMIFKSDTPKILTKALSIQIQALTNNACKYNIPEAYLSIGAEKNQAIWNSENFCAALDHDINELMETFGYAQILGEKHMVPEKTKKM